MTQHSEFSNKLIERLNNKDIVYENEGEGEADNRRIAEVRDMMAGLERISYERLLCALPKALCDTLSDCQKSKQQNSSAASEQLPLGARKVNRSIFKQPNRMQAKEGEERVGVACELCAIL